MLSILTGDICWVSGPYEAGRWSDIKIFRNLLMSHLEKERMADADDGYIGEHPQWVKCPKGLVKLGRDRVYVAKMQKLSRNGE